MKDQDISRLCTLDKPVKAHQYPLPGGILVQEQIAVVVGVSIVPLQDLLDLQDIVDTAPQWIDWGSVGIEANQKCFLVHRLLWVLWLEWRNQ